MRLSEIIEKQNELFFPVIGKDGYGGEQDGTHVIFGGFECRNIKEAEKIKIPAKAKLHYAEYHPNRGWIGAIGVWSDQIEVDKDFPGIDFY